MFGIKIILVEKFSLSLLIASVYLEAARVPNCCASQIQTIAPNFFFSCCREELFENIYERYRTMGMVWKLSMAITSLSLSSAFPNLLPPSSVLNYLLTSANLLAAELWSALNELLREHHKLEYSALSRARDVGQRVLPGTRDYIVQTDWNAGELKMSLLRDLRDIPRSLCERRVYPDN